MTLRVLRTPEHRALLRRELWLLPLILAGAVAAVLGFVAMGVG